MDHSDEDDTSQVSRNRRFDSLVNQNAQSLYSHSVTAMYRN